MYTLDSDTVSLLLRTSQWIIIGLMPPLPRARLSTTRTVSGFPYTGPRKLVTLTHFVVNPNATHAVLHYQGANDYDPTSTPQTPSGTALLEYNMGM